MTKNSLKAIGAVAILVQACSVEAQILPPPADLEQRIRNEVEQWTPLFWQVRETGILPPQGQTFQFTVLPYLPREWDPFGPAFAIFEKLYASRLQPNPHAGPVYLLDDLLRDDPQVLAEFRQYTLTGTLSTSDEDSFVFIEHLDLVAQAYAHPEDHPEFACVYMDGEGNLISEGLSPPSADESDEGGVQPLDGDDVPQDIKDLKKWLEDQLEDSDLDGVEYIKDQPFWFPGFDCDDYAEAYWAWLKNHGLDTKYPGIQSQSLWMYWWHTWGVGKGGKHGKAGHAVLMITYNGYYFVIDPMSGEVYGPFPSTTPLEDIDWIPFLDPTPGQPDDDVLPLRTPDSITPHDPRDRPWTDPNPWHEDQDMRDHLEDGTGRPASDYIWIIAGS